MKYLDTEQMYIFIYNNMKELFHYVHMHVLSLHSKCNLLHCLHVSHSNCCKDRPHSHSGSVTYDGFSRPS